MKTLERKGALVANGMQTIGSREAKNRFGNLLNTTTQGQPYIVTRNSRPEAVILPMAYFDLMGGEKVLFEKIAEDMKTKRDNLLQLMDEIADEAEKNGLTEEILNDILKDE